MASWFPLTDTGAVELFGIRLVGVNAVNGSKLLFSLVFILVVYLLGWLLRGLSHMMIPGKGQNERIRFWTRQGIQVFTAVLLIIGLISIWFDDPTRLTTAAGMVTAGLAFALQRVVTAIAGYVVILRGNTFSVGDRIVMGGVRGDVIALRFTQTVIMEMGQPPGEQSDAPSMWIRSRQYTGRIVSVTNARIFDDPVYNYSREFPYIWEEMTIPISFNADRARAEQILLDTANRHTTDLQELSEDALQELERRYAMSRQELRPRVYWRITDNWLELSARFIAGDHGVRELKDQMSREILAKFDKAGIGIASATYDVVGFPRVEVALVSGTPDPPVLPPNPAART